ncbi:Crp/Fnr family transcriptional regulator [Candidatus Saccharibacteria bacterium]|nr:Crp/Fnr family transcriptional regulator [Candidatus Saccharibacteria bacterium]
MSASTSAVFTPPKNENESIIAHFSDGLLMTFAKEETVISGIDNPEGVYLIKEGFIKAYSLSKAGHSNLLLIHEAGEFIPLPWALDGAHTTGLYYEAMSDVTVLRASKDKLRSAMGNNSWLSQEVLKQAVNVLAMYTNRIQTLEYRSARGRIISELLNLAERFGDSQGKKVIINAPITHQDIADSINMTRETASRALGLLFEEKLVTQEDHLFAILDLPRLQAALS